MKVRKEDIRAGGTYATRGGPRGKRLLRLLNSVPGTFNLWRACWVTDPEVEFFVGETDLEHVEGAGET